jgi:hypothetical protein
MPSGIVRFPVRDTQGNETLADFALTITAPGGITHGSQVTAQNTGWRGLGLTLADLTSTGSITTTHHEQVIERKRVSGNIQVQHDDVTIRGCKIEAPLGAHPIKVDTPGVSGLRVEFTEAHQDLTQGGDRNALHGSANVGAGQLPNVAYRCDLHHTADGVRPSNGWRIEECLIHPEVKFGSSHNDGLHSTQDSGAHSPAISVVRSKVIMGHNFGNACLYFECTNGDHHDLDLIDNWLQASSATGCILLTTEHTGAGSFLGTTRIERNWLVQGWDGGPEFGIRLVGNVGTIVRSGNRKVNVAGNDLGSAD